MLEKNPLHKAFIEAGQQAGYPFTDDMNGFQQEGFGSVISPCFRPRGYGSRTVVMVFVVRRPVRARSHRMQTL